MDSQVLNRVDRVQAVLFDMDGTLLDSEHLAARAIDMLLTEHRVQIVLEKAWFHGLTWRRIAEVLRTQTEALNDVAVESVLQARFHTALVETTPGEIPGARAAVIAASRRGGTAVVSSSDRVSVRHVVTRLGLEACVDHLVTAEDCQRSKPDPQCFQVAAERLGVDCADCLVFEDSVAGLTAARAAGMVTIAIGADPAGIAHHAVSDFSALPPGFFDAVGVR